MAESGDSGESRDDPEESPSFRSLASGPARPPRSCDGTFSEVDGRCAGASARDLDLGRSCTGFAPGDVGRSTLDLARSFLRRDASPGACGRRSDLTFSSKSNGVCADASRASARSVGESGTGGECAADDPLSRPLLPSSDCLSSRLFCLALPFPCCCGS